MRARSLTTPDPRAESHVGARDSPPLLRIAARDCPVPTARARERVDTLRLVICARAECRQPVQLSGCDRGQGVAARLAEVQPRRALTARPAALLAGPLAAVEEREPIGVKKSAVVPGEASHP